MSHELRTPLNAILGFAQLFAYDKEMDEDKQSNAREIYNAGEHLLSLINEVLDLAKIESGHIELSMAPVSLSAILDECLAHIGPLAETRGIIVGFESSQHRAQLVNADYTRLKQVLLNLLSNAVKYNRENGYIGIRCTTASTDTLRISIRDTGYGISNDLLEQLFQPFNRLGAEFGDTEGSGIGLVITRQLIELMGGAIGVDSHVGKGSTFWVELKTAATASDEVVKDMTDADSQAPELVAIKQVSNDQARLLVAEDNVANQAVFRQQLDLLGYNADIVENGLKAWEAWQHGNYDILLTDINMPLMDGHELVVKIRDTEQQTGAHIPIIAITANAMDDDAKRCLENGMDAFITKPVSLKDLQLALEKWLPEGASQHITNKKSVSSNKVVEGDMDIETGTAVDISMLQMLVGDDTEKHRLLFKTFIDSAPETIQAIQVAHREHAIETIRLQAHKLKSSARSMGAHELADTCQALEIAAKADNRDEIDTLTPQLDGRFKEVNEYIENYSAQTPSSEATINAFFEPLKILLVDDDHVMLNIEMMILNELGINDVITAMTGEEALKVLEEIDGMADVIICDLNMPEMDGVELLRHLAARSYTGAVMLVSGEDARILNTAKKLAAEHRLNVIGVLKKPLTPAEVKDSLSKLETAASKAQTVQKTQPQIVLTAEELQHGIENDELVAFFQPKVDVLTREVVGMETLVRWQHPDKGMIAPYYFIQLAEENGLIDALTQAVFKQAMQHAASLQASGFNIKVAINISVDTLNDLDWPEYAIAQANNASIDPSNIILEITESRLIENMASALEILTRLSLKKFRLSIDDFGTGYSSMEQLQRVPFSELKIDRAFVNGATHDKSARAILESSVDLAKKLDMSIVAEGVETQEDWDLIAKLGCHQVQGYLIAKPMPFDELKIWLEQWEK